MIFEHRALLLPKDIRHPDENQDAFAADGQRGVASLADGVSSSLFAGSWASILARAVVASPPRLGEANALDQWLRLQRMAWREPIDVSKLAWHQKPKFEAGAFSTLLWVQLLPVDPSNTRRAGQVRLQAYAIGDGCLFHVRGRKVLRAFPIEDSRLFDQDPQVIGSIARESDQALPFLTLDDYCRPGDLLVLSSDAIAAWALRQLEAGRSPDWEAQWQMPQDSWTQWLLGLRENREIRYDDSTVLMLRVLEPLEDGGLAERAEELVEGIQEKLRPAMNWFRKR